jgi:hypothetical protein
MILGETDSMAKGGDREDRRVSGIERVMVEHEKIAGRKEGEASSEVSDT